MSEKEAALACIIHSKGFAKREEMDRPEAGKGPLLLNSSGQAEQKEGVPPGNGDPLPAPNLESDGIGTNCASSLELPE